jgi:hypothetical protein
MTNPAAEALTGPAPTWRPGYDQDEPVYLDCVRAMGIPGQDGPTGGDVVRGEIEEEGRMPAEFYGRAPRELGSAAEAALEETPGQYEPHE